MLKKLNTYIVDNKKKVILFLIATCLSVIVAGSVNKFGFWIPLGVLGAVGLGTFLVAVFKNPKLAFWVYFGYCFVLGFLVKTFLNIPVGLALDAILLLTWCSILVNMNKFNWQSVKNEHVLLSVIWFVISVLQVLNPYGSSLTGWFNELRFTALNWLLIAPLVFLLFNKMADLNRFIASVLFFSCVATVYGVKQFYLGISGGEQQWLNAGNDYTHIINGTLRVFSMYSDAGQFGASQAIIAVIALVLAMGPFSFGKRIIFGLVALICLYGMALSGTRGALFALVSGLFFALLLSKNFKILILGVAIALSGLGVLKYTKIGDEIFQVRRLRSALDPKDASFNVRLENQKKLKSLLKDEPFGAGLGMSGINGITYNADKPIANIPPDSYWVKVWVMYGIVGLFIWMAINCYIIGKCSGIVWKLKEPKLRTKMIALTSGTAGCFLCSYGNEIMNGTPSYLILFMSWSFVFIAPWLDSQPKQIEANGDDL
ncbi:O-antigen ligase domain-containing protein [Pedobacter chinensis]|uniref:O-antigen ligase domain-containing protein n=1 Tax=Pedobacter chinensis TaxID=2282421 RepID=A0A369PUD7_9SPHI|nr:O-antigen ligase family protein [Pedobacter chinensis]RDC56193.1 O-antigen ligase domain-containing protein [Pedobacter chinensis]